MSANTQAVVAAPCTSYKLTQIVQHCRKEGPFSWQDKCIFMAQFRHRATQSALQGLKKYISDTLKQVKNRKISFKNKRQD